MPRPPAPSREERGDRHDVAFLAPFFGVLLLTPPLLNLFEGLRLPFGVPLEVLYLFTVWVLLIVSAVMLSLHRQFRESAPKADAEGVDAPAAEPPGQA
ncbi:hypothetical protein ATER59S_00564 [Aquamicrobium terrae]